MNDQTEQGRPAATVIIVRDVPGGPPELLMTERAATMVFAAGALVFPGGAVDESDRALAATIDHGLDPDEAAARVAAIRETLEESGLGVGLTGPVEPAALAQMRAALGAGEALAALAAARGIAIDLHQLVPFARWHPSRPEKTPRIYDTRFYLARAPEGQEPSADARENVRLFWDTAGNVLSRSATGELRIIFPTRRNLERIGRFASFEDLATHAGATPVEKVRPWLEDRDGEAYLCIPAHLGYEVTAEPMASVLRD